MGMLYFGEVISVSVTICGYRFLEKNLAKLDMAGNRLAVNWDVVQENKLSPEKLKPEG